MRYLLARALFALAFFSGAAPALVVGQVTLPQVAPKFIDTDRALAAEFGTSLGRASQTDISAAIVALAERLPVGGAIELPRNVACGRLDFRRVADGVQITGGHGGAIVLGGGQSRLQIMFSSLDEEVLSGLSRPPARIDPSRADQQLAAREFSDVRIFGAAESPASDLFAMFNRGSIKISHDVDHCAWIAGEGAFGRRTVTADAKVDNSLFLWFGINWPFADYNQHWNPKNASRDWVKENAQLDFNLHGGGEGTRIYEMIETNYGNPGPSAVFEDCQGTAIFHGSTERGSAQGPGVYYLKNCKGVQLGLRGINAFGVNNGDPRAADANRDITIEGGKGNILYAMRTWSNSNEVSLWNSDPELQLWEVASQYGQQGTAGAFRFAVTPYYGRPTPDYLAKLNLPTMAKEIFQRRAQKMKTDGNMAGVPNPDSVERLTEKLKTGRHMDAPFNATDEETLMAGKVDLTQPSHPAATIPAPPRVPATDAPRTRRPIAFTQTADFGRALLEAGADPTGKQPSDEAFATLLYGVSREKLQEIIDEAISLETDFRRVRGERDAKLRAIQSDDKSARTTISESFEPRLKKLRGSIDDNERKLQHADDSGGGKKGKRGRGTFTTGKIRLDIPAGTFYLKRPLYLLAGVDGVFGAGPEKTILRTDQPIQVVKLQTASDVANLAIEGGRTGLALTGSDHDDVLSPLLHSYVYGHNFYNITFRNQSFAGMHVGTDEEGIRGGSEHDQNKYVDLRFLNTGKYGIYFNVGMLDKWLCLHGEFVGQKTAGIACQFNNLIHGCIIDSTFTEIDGSAIDFFGGNCEIGYVPWEVWIDGCRFNECGSAEHFAVEQGLTELSAFTHNRITTKTKTIAGGYAGSPQICEDNSIDVKLADGAPAMKLRGVRTISVSRSNGHVLRDITANGPVVFVNDAEQHGDLFAKSEKWLRDHNRPVVAKWDTNPMARELAPKNGWVHPFIFYHCDFAGQKYDYTLLNVDPAKNKILTAVDLTPLVK